MESGRDFCGMHRITSENQDESNLGYGSGRGYEGWNIIHWRIKNEEYKCISEAGIRDVQYDMRLLFLL